MGTYSDPQLLADAREHAFSGLMDITALSDEITETRRELRNHFSAILDIIDTLVNG